MSITLTQVQKVAKLANLPLKDHELEKYSSQLNKILDYIDKLNQVETSGVEPTFNVTNLNNVFREDVPGKSLSQEEALKNAPLKDKGFFMTKGVFEE